MTEFSKQDLLPEGSLKTYLLPNFDIDIKSVKKNKKIKSAITVKVPN